MREKAFINHSITNGFQLATNRYNEDTYFNVHRTHQVYQIGINNNSTHSNPCVWIAKSAWDGPDKWAKYSAHCYVLWALLNLILCLQKGLYSINSRSIHSSNLTIYLNAWVGRCMQGATRVDAAHCAVLCDFNENGNLRRLRCLLATPIIWPPRIA